MTATWTGVISMGLVVVPIRLYAATEEHRVRLREVHRTDSGRIRHRRWCELEGREVAYEDVGRGAELPDGRIVELDEEDLERLPLPTRHVAQILGIVPTDDVDPLSYHRAYWAAPATSEAERPYTLLTAALARTGSVAVARVALRSRERLAVFRPRRGILACQTLYWPDEVREPGDLAPSTPVTDRELQLAETLLRELTGVEPAELHDEYAHALDQLVQAKVAGTPLTPAPEPRPTADLISALQESIRSAHVRRPGGHSTDRT